MGRYYGIKIRDNIMTFEQVPKIWRTMTEKWLQQNPE